MPLLPMCLKTLKKEKEIPASGTSTASWGSRVGNRASLAARVL
jgi:hypothetical protein